MSTQTSAWPGAGNRSVERALQLLQLIAQSEDALRFADLERQSGLAKATLHQLLGSLIRTGWVDRDADTGRLEIGLAAFEVGTQYPVQVTLREVGAQILKNLAADINETCHFGQLTEGDVLYLDRALSTHPVRFAVAIGGRRPAYATSMGKAMLSRLTEAEVRALYSDGLEQVGPHTVSSVDALIEQLATIRQAGHAIDDEETASGVRCVGVPIPAEGRLLAISVSAPVQRVTVSDLMALVPRISEAANDVAKGLSVLDWFGDPQPQ